MWISPAMAADFTPGTDSSGGGIALLVIIGSLITVFFVHSRVKKWLRRDP